MAKRGGFPGGGMPGNMANQMKKAQKKQPQEEELSKVMENYQIKENYEGGAVEVTMSGTKKITKVKLDEEVVDPDDVEMLEDLIVAAVNEVLEKVDEASAAAMSKFTGGMGGGMPGLF
ncbi:YbaB/EbfC family nucleoid-associated protein [Merdimonas faecis]